MLQNFSIYYQQMWISLKFIADITEFQTESSSHSIKLNLVIKLNIFLIADRIQSKHDISHACFANLMNSIHVLASAFDIEISHVFAYITILYLRTILFYINFVGHIQCHVIWAVWILFFSELSPLFSLHSNKCTNLCL